MPSEFRERLLSVKGTFKLSRKEVFSAFSWTAVGVAAGAFIVGIGFSHYRLYANTDDLVEAGVGVLIMGLFPLMFLPRTWAKYVFQDGYVSKVDERGRAIWREQLASAPRVVLCDDRLNYLITLRWAERRRTFVVPRSLLSALGVE